MKIAIFSDNFYPEISGISDSLIMSAKGLAKRGHSIMFYVPHYSSKNYETASASRNESFLEEGVGIKRLFSIPYPTPTKQGRFVVPLGSSIRSLRKFDPDVIHTQLFFGAGLEALLAARVLKKPIIGTNHTVISEFYRYSPIQNRFFLRFVSHYVNWYYGQCEMTTSPSFFLLKEMEENGFKSKSRVLYNPVDLSSFKPKSPNEKSDLKKEFGISSPAVVYAGRLSYEKKVDVLIQAFAFINKKNRDASLVLAGHGEAASRLKELARSLRIEKNVKFTGTLSQDKLARLLAASEVYASASTSEVQSIAMLQAMASGLPVVGVKSRGLLEHITPGKSGLLADVGNPADLAEKIISLLEDQELGEKLGKGALEFAHRFSLPKIISEWENVYEEMRNTTRKG